MRCMEKIMSLESWHSYPSSFAIGHRAIADLLLDPVTVEEKVDGSQFSFGLFNVDGDMQLRARSKGAQLNLVAPESMFAEACEVVKALPLREGWTYRAEYLKKPKHNALAYGRIPKNHLIIFDINCGHEAYLSYADKRAEAERLELEVVPLIYSGLISNVEQFRAMLDHPSILGGQKIEGVVIKNYSRFGADKKILVGKFVSEFFKEMHVVEWKDANPTSKDIVGIITESLRTPARWQKAVQHLTEAGVIEGSPRDIGVLIKEIQEDVGRECAADISDKLYQWACKHIFRGVVRGFPEWYKERLLEQQFNRDVG